jgi:hypothetical protein
MVGLVFSEAPAVLLLFLIRVGVSVYTNLLFGV